MGSLLALNIDFSCYAYIHVMPINLLDFYSKLGQYCRICITVQHCNYCNNISIINRY